MAVPILPSVISSFSPIYGILVIQVLKIRLKQEYKNAEAKYFRRVKNILIESMWSFEMSCKHSKTSKMNFKKIQTK